jgi:hypothetical protein
VGGDLVSADLRVRVQTAVRAYETGAVDLTSLVTALEGLVDEADESRSPVADELQPLAERLEIINALRLDGDPLAGEGEVAELMNSLRAVGTAAFGGEETMGV